LANHLKRRQQHDGKIPKLTGIGGFRLSDKTSTQADNATRGLAKYKTLSSRLSRMRTDREAQGNTEGPLERQGALGWGIPMLFLGRQRDPGKE